VEHFPSSEQQNAQQKGNLSSFHSFHEDTIDTTMTFTIYTTLICFYLYCAFIFLALVAAGWVAQKIVVFVCVRTLGLGFGIVRSSKMIIFVFVAFVVRVVLVLLQLFDTANMLSSMKQLSVVKSDEKAFDDDNHKNDDDDVDDDVDDDDNLTNKHSIDQDAWQKSAGQLRPPTFSISSYSIESPTIPNLFPTIYFAIVRREHNGCDFLSHSVVPAVHVPTNQKSAAMPFIFIHITDERSATAHIYMHVHPKKRCCITHNTTVLDQARP
jgi:hypothetical protein